jgi:amidohydrolase
MYKYIRFKIFQVCLSSFAVLIALSGILIAQQETIDRAVERLLPAILEKRHTIHRNPELGNREFETSRLVAGHLRELGLEVTTGIAYTGVLGILQGGKTGPVVAVRADMDALPVTEDTPYDFKSTVRTTYLGKDVGVMHACGHDIHTAVQLGVASVLASMREDIPGTVMFIFQPSEEGPPPGEEGGADLMLAEGIFDILRPSAIFGLHSFSEMQAGTIGYTIGPALAATDRYVIRIHGRQAHGAAPHLSVDPVVMASQVVSAFQTIRSRNLNPLEPSVITVGIIRGGERFNIIPEEVYLEGTVRTYSKETQNKIISRMNEILTGITNANGGLYEMDYFKNTPATINNAELTKKMLPAIQRVVGDENVIEVVPTMGGEDFAYFANEVPGFFYRLGSVKPGAVSGGHHTPTFQADDSCISVGMRVMSSIVMDYLASGGMD